MCGPFSFGNILCGQYLNNTMLACSYVAKFEFPFYFLVTCINSLWTTICLIRLCETWAVTHSLLTDYTRCVGSRHTVCCVTDVYVSGLYCVSFTCVIVGLRYCCMITYRRQRYSEMSLFQNIWHLNINIVCLYVVTTVYRLISYQAPTLHLRVINTHMIDN